MSDWIDRPVPFGGTPEQATANYVTHHWTFDGDVLVCLHCDSKSWHESASYPCGEDPPREIVIGEVGELLSGMALRAAVAHEIDNIF
jgi:hypothetical protein